MAREILFRGKRVIDGEWVESCCPLGEMHAGTVTYDFDSKTVCQYTGLTDKNGRKIFEGDIVKDSSCDLYTVNWSDENGMYEVRQYDCSMTSFETFFACDCEVIGNIFDNPELMEVC